MILVLAISPAWGIDMEDRVDGLEARLESLTRRVQAMEAVLKEGAGQAPATTAPKGEPVWLLDDYLSGSPFRVINRSLDRTSGRVDLLLDVVSEIPDRQRWQSLSRGAPVPLMLTLNPRPGESSLTVPLHLERGPRIETGSRVHVSAQISVDQARLVRGIQVGHVAATGADLGRERP